MNSFSNLSAADLRKAADIKEKIESLRAELGGILGEPTQNSTFAFQPGKRRMSAAGRAAISAAAKARWARIRKGAAKASNGEQKSKRQMSAAAKARLSAIAKARWKKAKASGKARL